MAVVQYDFFELLRRAGWPEMANDLAETLAENPDLVQPSDLEARVGSLEGFAPLTPSGGDDWAMIQDAADVASLRDSESGEWGPPARGTLRLDGRFTLSDTLVLRDCNVDGSSAVLEFPPDIPVCVDIGDPEVPSTHACDMVLPQVVRSSQGDRDTIGVRFRRMDGASVTVGSWRSHYAAVSEACGGGVVNTTVFVKRLSGVHPLALLESADEAGYTNQLTFIGGNYQCYPYESDSVPIRIDRGNNHLFLNPNIELASGGMMFDVAGQMNQFLNPRFEGSTGAVRQVRFRGPAYQNLIVGGYELDSLEVVDESDPPDWVKDRFNGIVSANALRIGGRL